MPKRASAKGHLPVLLLLVPLSLRGGTADLCLHRRTSITNRWIWFSFLWGHCFFTLGPGAYRILFMPSKSGVSASPSPVEALQSNPTEFKVRFLGDSQFFCRIPRLGSLMWGLEPLQKHGTFFGIIVLQFFSYIPGQYGILS